MLAASLRGHASGLTITFYGVLSVGLLFVAMEEIAWGQFVFYFSTPGWMEKVNEQGEFTFHNIGPVHDVSSSLPQFVFGVGGLIGVYLNRFRLFKDVAAPVVLLPWFILITGQALFEHVSDSYGIQPHLDWLVRQLAEPNEMLIALAALLYVFINATALARKVEITHGAGAYASASG
jgi:hypothetical protein